MVAKGRVIGGPKEGRKRGMLPPTGTGPIEVTRDYLESENQGGPEEPDSGTGVPKQQSGPTGKETASEENAEESDTSSDLTLAQPLLPSADAPRTEIITIASRVVHGAVVRYEEGQRRLTDTFFQEAGPAVRLVHATTSFKSIEDPTTGKMYRSFRKWAMDSGVSKSHAYRMINEIPVTDALGELYTGPLPSGHVDVLAPVLRQHGTAALRKLWETAEAGAKAARNGGRPTAADLVKARQLLGLNVSPENDEPPVVGDPARTFKQVQSALRVLADTDAIRLAMQHDPQALRELVRDVFGATADDSLADLEPGSVPTRDTSEGGAAS